MCTFLPRRSWTTDGHCNSFAWLFWAVLSAIVSITTGIDVECFDIINSCAWLREQLVLKGLFDIVYGGKYDFNNLCNNNGYNYPPTYPTAAPVPTVDFNNIGIGLPALNILKGIYGVGLCEKNVINEINNNNGMWYFLRFSWGRKLVSSRPHLVCVFWKF